MTTRHTPEVLEAIANAPDFYTTLRVLVDAARAYLQTADAANRTDLEADTMTYLLAGLYDAERLLKAKGE